MPDVPGYKPTAAQIAAARAKRQKNDALGDIPVPKTPTQVFTNQYPATGNINIPKPPAQVFRNQFPPFVPPVPPPGTLGPVRNPNLTAPQYQSMFQNFQAQQQPAFGNQNIQFANTYSAPQAPGWNPTNPYMTSNPWNTMNPFGTATPYGYRTFAPYSPNQWAPTQTPAGIPPGKNPGYPGGVPNARKEGIWTTFQNPDDAAAGGGGGLGGGGWARNGGGGGSDWWGNPTGSSGQDWVNAMARWNIE